MKMNKELEKKFVSLEWEIMCFFIISLAIISILVEKYIFAIVFLVLGCISLFLFQTEWEKFTNTRSKRDKK